MTILEEEIGTVTRIKHELLEISHEGDTKTTWDPSNAAEVDAARLTFASLKEKGFMGYSVKDDGTPDSVLHEFDATQGRIIMKPALAGG